MAIEIRNIEPAEVVDYVRAKGRAFGYHPDPGAADAWHQVNQVDRAFAAFEQGAIVGATTSYPFQLTLPGGATPAVAGIAGVAVLPTHRRQGVMRALVEHQRKDIASRGEAASILWPSEPTIYGRFGFGTATRHASIKVSNPSSVEFAGMDVDGRISFVKDEDALATLQTLHDDFAAATPGEVQRSAKWLKRVTDAGPDRDGNTAPFHVTHSVDGVVDGWMSYRYKKTGPLDSNMAVKVEQFFAVDDAARHALWQYAFSLDLVETLTATHIPVDDPLLSALEQLNAAQITYSDALWMHVGDIVTTLSARRYAKAGYVTFALDGQQTYSIDADGAGAAECMKTTANAAFEIGAGDLSALVLGTTRAKDLYRAGRLGPCDKTTLDLVDAMFTTEQAPYCSLYF